MASRLSKKTWIIIAVTLVIAVGALVRITLSRNSSSPADITLPIITWDETTLSELAGTLVVLNFWLHGVPVAAQSYPILSL
jgi:hypothetical protein